MLKIKRNTLIILSILSLVIIVGGYLISNRLFRQNLPRSEMTLVVKYTQVPPVIQDFFRVKIRAFYRGYPVGQVSRIELSDNQKYIVFYLDIYYKNLKLPKNILIFLDSEDLYGARHFNLYYPDKPSSEILKNGDEVWGTGANERIDKFLVKDMQSGRISRLVSNLINITDALNMLVGGKNAQNLSEIINDPEVKNDIKSTIKASSRSLNNINEILENPATRQTISTAPQTINRALTNLESVNNNLSATNTELPKVNKTVSTTNCLLYETNCNLGEVNRKVPEIPSDLVTNADKSLKKADCLMTELSKVLSKRFLGLRFVFGRPAASLEKCSKNNCNQCK